MHRSFRPVGWLAAPALLLTLSGCGGGVSGGGSSTSFGGSTGTPGGSMSSGIPGTSSVGGAVAPNAQSALNVFVTDAFSDQYKQVLVSLAKIELTTDGATYQTVFSEAAGRTVNLTSLAGTQELLAGLNVPTGAYTQARITFGDHVTLVAPNGVSTSVPVDPKVGTATGGLVALTVPVPAGLIGGQSSALVVDFKLAGFRLVGGVLRPAISAGGGGAKSCLAHLDGTVSNFAAGKGFDLSGQGGRALHVILTPTTTVVSGQAGSAATPANGQSVRVEGTLDAAVKTVTAASVVLNDYATAKPERAEGTVAGGGKAGRFVLTVQRADGLLPTGGTITVQTSSATVFGKGKRQAAALADLAPGATADVQGSFEAATQTLTARAVFLR